MTVSNLAEYRTRAEQVFRENPDAILGSLLWYSVTEGDTKVRVSRDDLVRWFDEAGLNPAFLPPELSPVNAFRSGSTNLTLKYKIDKHRTATLRFKEVAYTNDYVLRHLLRDVTDNQDGGSHTTAHVASLRFTRNGKSKASQGYKVSVLDHLVEYDLDNNKTGNTYPLSDQDRAQVELILGKFQQAYAIKATFYEAQAIRELIRKVFTSTNAILAKKAGGVYFIHTDHQPTVDAIQKVLRSIGNGCDLFQTPLFDLPDALELISSGLYKEINNDVESIMRKVSELNGKYGNGKIPAKQYANLLDDYQTAAGRVEDIVVRTDQTQELAGSALEVAQMALAEMSTRLGA
jgi:hypothetical protein